MSDLDALLRRASRIAEHQFNKWGVLDAFWLVEKEGGKQEIIVAPMPPNGPDSGHMKQQIADGLRRLFKERKVRRYAWGRECWTVEDKATDAIPGSLHEHPDRKEVVVICADDGFETRIGYRDIIRTGGDAYLGKLDSVTTQGPRSWGRFLSMLGNPQQSGTA